MSRQDKATTEKHARILRELVKRPENKVCGDCKRNDPRWASWNIGIFLCIRCSGIHRGMGTHISKVKSIDLDTWTPEQMQSIQCWGNRRANLYWEAHLKLGHVPPDHKIESFIRSKYESRRWALDGPPPEDPTLLDDQSATDHIQESAQKLPATTISSLPAHVSDTAQSNRRPASPIRHPFTPQTHKLLSTAMADRSQQVLSLSVPTTASSQVVAQNQQNQATSDGGLFSLDFHAPASVSVPSDNSSQPKKDVKQDILSLFSVSSVTPASPMPPFGQLHTGSTQQLAWDSPNSSHPHQTVQATSMMGSNGIGQWGSNSGWTIFPPAQNNLWGHHLPAQQQPSRWESASTGSSTGEAAASSKQEDIFGDLWGGFK